MMRLEKAIDKCTDRCNLALAEDDDCVIKFMYQYKAIRELDDPAFCGVYEQIVERLGLLNGCE